MSKCSCGVVPGDCYDACGARESKISDLINERDEARAEAAALRGVVQVGINVMTEPMTARQATWVIDARIALNDIPPERIEAALGGP